MSATLADWLDTLRDRDITASIDNRTVTLHGDVTAIDRDWLHRHHDAFIHATTLATWWSAVTGRTFDQLDVADCPDGCLVADCPGELEHYTPDALPYCAAHNPAHWTGHLEQEAAA